MDLEAIYKSQNEIPEAFRGLYSERNGQYELTGIKGIKTQADVDRISEGLRKERDDHKKTRDELSQIKGSLGPWATLKPEEIQQRVDGYDALKLDAESAGTVTQERINQRLQAELARHTAPLERKITDYENRLSEATQQVQSYQQRERQRAIHDAVRTSALTPRNGAPILNEALEDALMLAERVFDVTEDGKVLTRDNVGITPGLDPDLWLQEMQPRRPHWWGPSEGGGAKGGKTNGAHLSNNPWAKDSFNLTKQGEFIKQFGMEKAQQAAKLAGTTIGGPAPAK